MRFQELSTEQFATRLTSILNDAATALMISLGHRLGLFDAMAELELASSQQIADATGCHERYVREWLGALVTAGVVEFLPEAQSYSLPKTHAALLTRSATPNNVAVFAQYIPMLGSVEELIIEAFRHGRGVPYAAYARFHQVMAEESGQTVVAALEEHILPLVDGMDTRLKQGIQVLDIGCGSGLALNRLSQRYPNSSFVGYDISEEGIIRAVKESERNKLTNVRFSCIDASQLKHHEEFDLVTAFDAIHDQAKPLEVLRNIRNALRPGGTFLMQDIHASSQLENNIGHPIGPFIYTISCLHCMSVSLASGGAGLGAAWGKELALQMLEEAGFADIRVETLPHDFQNCYFIMQK